MAEATGNPFAALLDRSNDENKQQPLTTSELIQDANSFSPHERLAANDMIEEVFLITVDKQCGKNLVFIPEVLSSMGGQDWLDFDVLSMALFERVLMPKPSDHLLASTQKSSKLDSAADPLAFHYLYRCYVRSTLLQKQFFHYVAQSYREKCQSVIIECASTCLQQPELCEENDVIEQMRALFFEDYFSVDSNTMQTFLERVYAVIYDLAGLEEIENILKPIFKYLHDICIRGFLGRICSDSTATNGLKQLEFFTQKEYLAKALLHYTEPSQQAAVYFEKSLFGVILSSNCAPNLYSENDFFSTPSRMTQADIQRVEGMIHTNTELVTHSLHKVFLALVKLSAEVKHLLLSWIAKLLSVNKGRVKLASTMSIHSVVPRDECCDGLMLNLCTVLLKLCQPFCQPQSPKLLKIQSVYCRKQYINNEEQRLRHHHAFDLPDQTFLIPLEENEMDALSYPEEYGFVCDLYFLTQQAMYFGFHATYERFMHLNRELSRLQSVYLQLQQGSGNVDEGLKFRFENSMKKFLSVKAALCNPQLLRSSMQFHISSATLLTHLATGGDNLTKFRSLKLPTQSCNTVALGCMPEFTLTNIIDAMELMRRFIDSIFQESLEFAGYIMDLILVFMGNRNRVKNPHLRAKLAAVLHELMPRQEGPTMGFELLKEQLFTHHPNIEMLAETLLTVFVSIETTGESVEFEQKLNYRQPMYKVIDFIWRIPLHRNAVKELSNEALLHIADTDPPLFLKFTNLLVNDANFLLDEALDEAICLSHAYLCEDLYDQPLIGQPLIGQPLINGRMCEKFNVYMRQIREKQEENDSRSTPLSGGELQQYEAGQNELSMLARFHNTAAIDTTHTLALLTLECIDLFCHSVMVDRIAAMLNYFLLQLTGPKMKAFKVKDFDKYEFKPSVLVSNICKIYLNLGAAEAFCTAVSADGRSYSSKLLPQAETVLQKIHSPIETIQEFNKLTKKIKVCAKKQEDEEDFMSSAPDEYLDAIMGTVMKDPVILPSSQMVVDRATIARHILSDQTDPFNRSPLTLEKVLPHTKLKEEIENWRASMSK